MDGWKTYKTRELEIDTEQLFCEVRETSYLKTYIFYELSYRIINFTESSEEF